ncbi:MAG: hypothetical protein IPK68_09690 [Bdellovibrionales bacterium]|nr:hypothetical protein [Bdellovibrionales bacterium]
MANLISNAIDFSPEKSKIEIEVTDKIGQVSISVRDHGAGIPDFALPKVFDKFFSLERPHTGKKSTGLGLPFVKEVVSLHGGEVVLKNVSPGLEVQVLLPLS